MTQLQLFGNGDLDLPKDRVIKSFEEKCLNAFLELYRNEYNQKIHTGQYIYELNSKYDIDTLKNILFKFDTDKQELVHKTITNFRINQLLHNKYDYLNETFNV